MGEFEEAKKKLETIKNTDDIIRTAVLIYEKKYPNYSKDVICAMVAEAAGKEKSSVWRKLKKDKNKKNRIITI